MIGYRPGLIADIVGLHAVYYARDWGFGLPFEAKVASELSAFMRDFRPGLDFFAAEDDDNCALLGTISLEAPTSTELLAHLRWFITSDGARGTGLGRRLMDKAMAHVDAKGFPGVYLTTFVGLGPARHLYESFGFNLVAEEERDQWSGGVREQRFERHRTSAKA
ncbi:MULTISPECIES: GNAT family N-acetyltransferase [Aminobacter]|jgi:GNAT superfamily N-acetyltransferase|uniref:GNAT superfamily N-acetyltransferase n=1 Tax=Aminobacter ciceronei TaxID=150723 RepID=A0ABR6C6U6_9HYPH|nr:MULTISPECIES: GNAT family N-acetyltransferase [Aminobacter]MBA8907010.1 GNAT superfamily N-acetyltransferase [Aminobacter ciceronei]MBA9020732.1 GNAT superfamily N-acetyltransferase [Aminobacter ciceronei]BBD40061.1 GNAT family N-acetyltransferase [Aminobacter sp. SS-2016]